MLIFGSLLFQQRMVDVVDKLLNLAHQLSSKGVVHQRLLIAHDNISSNF